MRYGAERHPRSCLRLQRQPRVGFWQALPTDPAALTDDALDAFGPQPLAPYAQQCRAGLKKRRRIPFTKERFTDLYAGAYGYAPAKDRQDAADAGINAPAKNWQETAAAAPNANPNPVKIETRQ